MPPPPRFRSGTGPRRWIHAWLLLIAPAWALGVFADVEMLRWVKAMPEMCQGLPDYGAASGALPEGPVGFLSGVPDPDNSRRFFCAQYDLAPHVLVWWRPIFVNLDRRQLAGTNLLLDYPDRAALAAFLRDLDAEAKRQGATVARRDISRHLILVTVRASRDGGSG